MSFNISNDQKPKNFTVSIMAFLLFVGFLAIAANAASKSFSFEAKARAEVYTQQAQALVEREFEINRHLREMNVTTEGRAKEAAMTFATWQANIRAIAPGVVLMVGAGLGALVLGLGVLALGWGVGVGAAGIAFGGNKLAGTLYEIRRALDAPITTPLPAESDWVIVNRKVMHKLTGRISDLEKTAQPSALIAKSENMKTAINVAGTQAADQKRAGQIINVLGGLFGLINEARKQQAIIGETTDEETKTA